MSKQDRQGVRKASDIERKYNLGGIAVQETKTAQQSEKMSQLNQSLSQFEVATNAKISALETSVDAKINELEENLSAVALTIYPVGSTYISVKNTDPSTLFGGTWEIFTEGYLLVGLDPESETTEILHTLEKCYIWKRTA